MIIKSILKEIQEEYDIFGYCYNPRRIPMNEYGDLRKELGDDTKKYGYDHVILHTQWGEFRIISDINCINREYFHEVSDTYREKILQKDRNFKTKVARTKVWQNLNN